MACPGCSRVDKGSSISLSHRCEGFGVMSGKQTQNFSGKTNSKFLSSQVEERNSTKKVRNKKQGVNITVHNSQNMETTCVYGQMNE